MAAEMTIETFLGIDIRIGRLAVALVGPDREVPLGLRLL